MLALGVGLVESRQLARALHVSSVLIVMAVVSFSCATAPKSSESAVDDASNPVNGESTPGNGELATEETMIVPSETIFGERRQGKSEASEDQSFEETETEVDVTYRIGPGDRLRFRSFDDESLSMEVVVRYDGYISLLLISDLRVQGLTREEAEALLVEQYTDFYAEPRLSLSITETSSKEFTVLGEVARPGVYPYDRPLSLIDAITAAGWIRINQQGGDNFLGSTGTLVKASIIRPMGDDRVVEVFDLRGFAEPGATAAYTPIFPGDIVHVPESANLVYLLGEVRQPSVYAISEGLTLNRLLAQAGGFNESTARYGQVIITRELNDTETKLMAVDVRENLKLGTDVLLQPGDIIYMPRKRLVNLAEFIRRVTAPASTAMSFTSQVLSLYSQAYQAYYTPEQYDLIYNNDNQVDLFTARLQQSLTNLQSALFGGNALGNSNAVLLQTLTDLQSVLPAPSPSPLPSPGPSP